MLPCRDQALVVVADNRVALGGALGGQVQRGPVSSPISIDTSFARKLAVVPSDGATPTSADACLLFILASAGRFVSRV